MATTTNIDEKNNLITFKNTGHRTTDSVAEAEDRVSQLFEKNGKVLLLIDWSEFLGQEQDIEGLIWNVAKLSLMVERVAIVARENMRLEIERWQRQVKEVPIRNFSDAQIDEARNWLITSEEKAVDC